ncbi:MAG: hypothetical protein ACM3PY_20440, partial [Omnitrophica WOR_2 bacterium]
LGVVPYQKDLFIEGMVTRVEDAAGKKARIPLEPGYILFSNMVTDQAPDISNMGSDAALLIPRGMVSLSIPINRLSSVSYAPQRGDHVNVIVTLLFIELDPDFQSRLPDLTGNILGPSAGGAQGGAPSLSAYNSAEGKAYGRTQNDVTLGAPFFLIPSEPQRPRMVSQTLIQDVIVLQMGEFPQPTEAQPTPVPGAAAQPTPVPQQQNQPTGTPVAPPRPEVITLIVTPQDAVTLNYLVAANARLTLALRGARDDTRVQTEAVTLQFLLDQYHIPIPAKLPYGLEPRIDLIPTQKVEVQATAAP